MAASEALAAQAEDSMSAAAGPPESARAARTAFSCAVTAGRSTAKSMPARAPAAIARESRRSSGAARSPEESRTRREASRSPISSSLDSAAATPDPRSAAGWRASQSLRSEEHTSELQSHHDLVCRLLLEKKK